MVFSVVASLLATIKLFIMLKVQGTLTSCRVALRVQVSFVTMDADAMSVAGTEAETEAAWVAYHITYR